MPTLYFSVCFEKSQALVHKMAGECETLWQCKCIVQGHDAALHSEQRVRETLALCDALILVIGNAPPGRPALPLDEPNALERIRFEIVSAMNRDILIVPLLLDEARLPEKEMLPGALKLLHDCTAHRMRSTHWYEDLHLLFEDLQKELQFKQEIEKKLMQTEPDAAQEKADLAAKLPSSRKWDLKTSPTSELRRTIDSEKFNLKEARRRADRTGEKKALSALGQAFSQLGQTRWAIQYFEEELELVRQSGNVEEECGLLANLGDAHAVSGDIDRAAGYYEQQLALAESHGLRQYVGSAHNGLGFVCVKRNRVDRAIDAYSKALSIFRELEDPEKQLELLVGIALNHQKIDNLQPAQECLRQALNLALYLEDRREEARISVDLAEICCALDSRIRAQGHLNRAEEIFSATTEPWADSWKQRIHALRRRMI